jgi:hypothetical protein
LGLWKTLRAKWNCERRPNARLDRVERDPAMALAVGINAAPVLSGQIKTSCPKYDVEPTSAWERQRLTSKVTDLGNDVERAKQRLAERRDRTQATMERAYAELARIQHPPTTLDGSADIRRHPRFGGPLNGRYSANVPDALLLGGAFNSREKLSIISILHVPPKANFIQSHQLLGQ